MKFKCVFVNKRTNKIINKDFTVAQIDKYLGEYIKDSAIKRGHTTTTVDITGEFESLFRTVVKLSVFINYK